MSDLVCTELTQWQAIIMMMRYICYHSTNNDIHLLLMKSGDAQRQLHFREPRHRILQAGNVLCIQ